MENLKNKKIVGMGMLIAVIVLLNQKQADIKPTAPTQKRHRIEMNVDAHGAKSLAPEQRKHRSPRAGKWRMNKSMAYLFGMKYDDLVDTPRDSALAQADMQERKNENAAQEKDSIA